MYRHTPLQLCIWGRRVIGISGYLICSKTLMELIFNPCGEFRWNPEGPVSQIHSPHLLVGASWIFTDLLRFVQMLERESVGCGKQRKLQHLFIPSKTAILVPEFAVEDLPSAELQPRFLSLQWRTCFWSEHSDDDDDDDDDIISWARTKFFSKMLKKFTSTDDCWEMRIEAKPQSNQCSSVRSGTTHIDCTLCCSTSLSNPRQTEG